MKHNKCGAINHESQASVCNTRKNTLNTKIPTLLSTLHPNCAHKQPISTPKTISILSITTPLLWREIAYMFIIYFFVGHKMKPLFTANPITFYDLMCYDIAMIPKYLPFVHVILLWPFFFFNGEKYKFSWLLQFLGLKLVGRFMGSLWV